MNKRNEYKLILTSGYIPKKDTRDLHVCQRCIFRDEGYNNGQSCMPFIPDCTLAEDTLVNGVYQVYALQHVVTEVIHFFKDMEVIRAQHS